MKNSCIFDTFNAKDEQKNHNIKGIFYAQKSDSDLNTGYQIPTYYLNVCFCSSSLARTGGDSLSYVHDNQFHTDMPKKNEITPKLNNSKLKSTSVARHATLNLSGCRTNPYLFCLRKIFRDFLEEEKRGHCFAETRLIKKIEAARLMFPEAHRELFNYLKR